MVGSGIPPGAISCTRRLPPEATLIVTWMGPSRSGSGGSVVTAPVHVPARPFKAPNETWASDEEGFCARAGLHVDSTQMQSNNGNDFMAIPRVYVEPRGGAATGSQAGSIWTSCA